MCSEIEIQIIFDNFTDGSQPHAHAGVSGAALKARVVRDVKHAERRHPFP